ncbi:MAG: hypothetical protein A2W31_09890 [Planctomycetes bacterium RBG_16_64_10]|nr:MAG: hypothetical protein A2W31_09890 [Planctomycetes bacterium RBG_16_64_10]
MRFRYKAAAVGVVLCAVGAASYRPLRSYWEARNRPDYRVASVIRGPIVWVINATGTVKPVLSVEVGTFVSGPIEELYVEFNERVAKGQLLARIDPRIYTAAVARDQAILQTQTADVKRVQALLDQAINDQERAQALYEEGRQASAQEGLTEDEGYLYISETELDQYRYSRLALEAQLDVAEASVKQARANLSNSEANLEYTRIKSPVDGMVIDRKIEPGQTLAASFQTPVLFIVAPDMEKKMHIFASVDETDIGLIRAAQQRGQPVHFTVDAYPDDLFQGTIEQIRFSSTTTQDVVTYPVVVAAPNPDLKLLPGMTASLSFQIEEKPDVVKIPSAALRFYPPDLRHVRPEDRPILEGAVASEPQEEGRIEVTLSAVEKAAARQARNRHHVWVVEGQYLRAIEAVTGLSESRYTELVSGPLREGQELVTGIKPKGSE